MAGFNDDKFKKMQDEMSRFEEEIGMPVPGGLPPPPPPPALLSKPKVIGTHTFSEVSKQLEAPPMPPLAPPPPPPSFIPHQVRAGLPGDHGLDSQFSSSYSRGGGGQSAQLQPPPQPPGNFGQQVITLGGPRPGFLPLPPATAPEKSGLAVLSGSPMLYIAPPPKEVPVVKPPAPLIREEEKRPPLLIPNFTGKSSSKKEPSESSSSSTSSKSQAAVTFSAIYDKYSQRRQQGKKNRKTIRTAGGQTWEDSTLLDWEDDDFRLFCGDLGNDVTDEVLTRAFSRYPSFSKAKVVRDKRTNKTKGYGFVSFKDPQDFIKASKEMNGRYVGSRPIKLRKSTWRNRCLDVVRKKDKEKQALITALTGK